MGNEQILSRSQEAQEPLRIWIEAGAVTGPGGHFNNHLRNLILNGGMWKGDEVRHGFHLADKIWLNIEIWPSNSSQQDQGRKPQRANSQLLNQPPFLTPHPPSLHPSHSKYLNHMNYFHETTNGIEINDTSQIPVSTSHMKMSRTNCSHSSQRLPSHELAVNWKPKYLLLRFPAKNFTSLTFRPIVSKQRT